MRLTRVEIQDYRSVFAGESTEPLKLELADGMNTLVGTNNCGKSNILRAIALALDPHYKFDPLIDTPGPRRFAYPIVTLVFRAQGDRDVDQELMRAVRGYETVFGPGTYFSEMGEIRLRVAYEPSENGAVRRESILLPSGDGPSDLVEEQFLDQVLTKLREAVRFVLISSGESIRSVLDGNFREILHSVVKEKLAEPFADAEASRLSYISGLEESLLAPLRDQLINDVGRVFPDIGGATLAPDVPSIERTLSNVKVSLEDLVATSLSEKGTGVRGGVLIAMLSYLASNATRGMIFAVEEPEAFLHPAAQEDLREDLEVIAHRDDVSLLVTTHSPHIVSRSGAGRVFGLSKDRDGRTRIASVLAGDADHGPIVSELYREGTFEEILQRSVRLADDAEAVLFVEGEGDKQSLELATELVGRPDLLKGISIRPAGGAMKTVLSAIVARAAIDPKPVLVLLDNDEPGRNAAKMLTGSTFRFRRTSEVLTYADVLPSESQNFPVEAEDLFDESLWEAFVDKHGQSVIKEMVRRPDGGFHFGFDQAGKELIAEFMVQNAEAKHVRLWIELILRLRALAGLDPWPETLDDLMDGAPETGSSAPEDQRTALVIADKVAYSRYRRESILLADSSMSMIDSVTHVGFYADGEVKPELARILRRYTSIRFARTTVEQLREAGTDDDRMVAEVIARSLEADDGLVGSIRQVLLLSPQDGEETVKLGSAIPNTKERNGRPLAWTVGPRVVSLSTLLSEPASTSDLDAIEEAESGNTRQLDQEQLG